MYFDAGLWRNWTNYDCKVKVEWGCDDVYSGSCSYTSKTNKDTQDISKTSYRVAQLRMYSWNTDDMLELNGFDTRNFTFSGVETPAKITLKETVADNIPVYGQLYWDEVFYMIQGTITGIGSGTLIESSP